MWPQRSRSVPGNSLTVWVLFALQLCTHSDPFGLTDLVVISNVVYPLMGVTYQAAGFSSPVSTNYTNLVAEYPKV